VFAFIIFIAFYQSEIKLSPLCSPRFTRASYMG
jgi:hypothetical protein